MFVQNVSCFCCLQQQQVTFFYPFIYENCELAYYLTKTQYNRNTLAALLGLPNYSESAIQIQ